MARASTQQDGGKRRAEDIGWKILKVRRYYNGMKRKLINTHKDRWEQGFAALSKFRRRKRHCSPPRDHLEGKFKLGRWVNTQRYLKDALSVERKRRLDRIGFVWNWREYLWEQGFAALLKFKHREGHCRVPIQHREGNFRLGYWVSTQRRKRTELPALRKRRLNKIGFVWREDQGYRRAMEIDGDKRRALTAPIRGGYAHATTLRSKCRDRAMRCLAVRAN